MPSGRLEGMVALITGAGGGQEGGMGAGTARCMAQEGARLAINDLKPEYAAATVEQLRAMGAEAFAVPGDVSDPDEAAGLVARTIEHFGQLDILVNNAVYEGERKAVERTPTESWLRAMAVNLNGPFFLCRAVVPHMRERKFGRIINILSGAAVRVSVMAGPEYTASKSGLYGLTRHLAVEVAQYGITVNGIMPGGTLTPLFKQHLTQEVIDEMQKAIDTRAPGRRIASPEDIGWLAVYLASREADHVSGQAINVDGGAGVLPGSFAAYQTASNKDKG